MLCKQGLHTDKEIVINKLDISIKNKKKRKEDVRTDRSGNTSGEECQDRGVHV
jgi:hypothetical protein